MNRKLVILAIIISGFLFAQENSQNGPSGTSDPLVTIHAEELIYPPFWQF